MLFSRRYKYVGGCATGLCYNSYIQYYAVINKCVMWVANSLKVWSCRHPSIFLGLAFLIFVFPFTDVLISTPVRSYSRKSFAFSLTAFLCLDACGINKCHWFWGWCLFLPLFSFHLMWTDAHVINIVGEKDTRSQNELRSSGIYTRSRVSSGVMECWQERAEGWRMEAATSQSVSRSFQADNLCSLSF